MHQSSNDKNVAIPIHKLELRKNTTPSTKSNSSHLKTLFLLLICYISDYNIALKFQTTSEIKNT